ncbi:PfkB family carbohydrate kinase [Streptomyces sp. M19]
MVEVTGAYDRCGGAANVAANLGSLGAETRLLAVVGADAAGRRLRRPSRPPGSAPTTC